MEPMRDSMYCLAPAVKSCITRTSALMQVRARVQQHAHPYWQSRRRFCWTANFGKCSPQVVAPALHMELEHSTGRESHSESVSRVQDRRTRLGHRARVHSGDDVSSHDARQRPPRRQQPGLRSRRIWRHGLHHCAAGDLQLPRNRLIRHLRSKSGFLSHLCICLIRSSVVAAFGLVHGLPRCASDHYQLPPG